MCVYRKTLYNYIKLLLKIVLFTVSVKLLRPFSGDSSKTYKANKPYLPEAESATMIFTQ